MYPPVLPPTHTSYGALNPRQVARTQLTVVGVVARPAVLPEEKRRSILINAALNILGSSVNITHSTWLGRGYTCAQKKAHTRELINHKARKNTRVLSARGRNPAKRQHLPTQAPDLEKKKKKLEHIACPKSNTPGLCRPHNFYHRLLHNIPDSRYNTATTIQHETHVDRPKQC